MPEFRFRRKKHQNHRHTLHDAEESSKQIRAAKRQVDKEKQTKYPEQSSGIQLATNGQPSSMANGHAHHGPEAENRPMENYMDDLIKTTSSCEMPEVKASLVRRISSRFSDCIFLRHESQLRRCPMPSPITLSTIKNLFVNMFDLSPRLLDDPLCRVLIQDKDTQHWKKLEDIGMVHDRCVLQLLESPSDPTPSPAPLPTPDPISQPSPPPSPSQDGSDDINMPLSLDTPNSLGSGEGEVKKNTTEKRNGLWRTDVGHQVEDLTALPDNLPLHRHTQERSPFSGHSSASEVTSGMAATHSQALTSKALVSRARSLQRSVTGLKEEMTALTKDHMRKMADFSHTMQSTTNRITAAIVAYQKTAGLNAKGSDVFRRERLEVYPIEEAYHRTSRHTLHELNILETAVEAMRMDVVERRARVETSEVEALLTAVEASSKDVWGLKECYVPLEEKLKRVMEQELRVIVQEEKFVQEEGPQLEQASNKCRKLGDTLRKLQQFAGVQTHRTPIVPIFIPVAQPDRQALLDNIEAIFPNHLHRLESIQRAESVQRRIKQLTSPKRDIKRFERQLVIQRDHLRNTHNINELERRRDMKLKAFFLKEKFNREKQIADELEWKRKLAQRKREQERIATEERWLREQKSKIQDKKTREKQSHKIVMQSVAAAQENVATSVTVTGPSHKRTGSDGRPGLGYGNENPVFMNGAVPATGRASLAVPRQRKLSNLQPGERKSIGYLGEFENLDPFVDPLPRPNPDANFIRQRHASGLSDTTVGGRKPPPYGGHWGPRSHEIQQQGKPRQNQHRAPIESLILRSKRRALVNASGNRHSMYEYDTHSQPSDQATSSTSSLLKAESAISLNQLEPEPPRFRHHSADAQEFLRPVPVKYEQSPIYDRLGVNLLDKQKVKHPAYRSMDSNLDKHRELATDPPPDAPRLPFRSNSDDSVVSAGIGASEMANRQFQGDSLDLARKSNPSSSQLRRTTIQGQEIAAHRGRPPSPPARVRDSKFHHSYTQFQPQTRGKPQSRPQPPPQKMQVNKRTEDQLHAHRNRSDVADNRPLPPTSRPSRSAASDNRLEQPSLPTSIRETQPFHWTNPVASVNPRPTKSAPQPKPSHKPPSGAEQPLTSYPRSYNASMANSLRSGPPHHGRGRSGIPLPSSRVTHYPNTSNSSKKPIVGSLV